MGTLTLVRAGWGIAVALAFSAPATANPSAGVDPLVRWRPHVEEASRRFGVPAPWIERVILAESGGRTEMNGRAIVSHAGAMGLMQLMPGTWAEMRRRLRLGADPHAPRDNILAGTLYLRMMHDRFGYPGLFGAYNAGPARYAAYLARTKPLPAETRAYIRAITGVASRPADGGIARRGRAPEAIRDASDVGAGAAGQTLFFIRR
ncbi:putative lytic transglycosylase [Novosphingobium resinovorum]|uniref:Putative lytic transglycosylase n=1 Tax=Novosphingobium resinovorum TaxID=158500 RepID=A0A031K206_9SPHN|nr:MULTISPECIES: lytic transglycosylase domain-containing protein [Novosphingobium]EZP84001.1 putative lytic transglycosylase [Novosphingobium resinovorum]